MIHKERWEFKQTWLDYVLETWNGSGRVQLVSDESLELLEFKNKADESFRAAGLTPRMVKTWVSVQEPEPGEGYAVHYPHVHYPLEAMTLVHYLDPGDKPAILDIFNGDKVVESVTPEQGLTVFMPNHVLHGVHKNNGHFNRVQMIATAL